MCLMHNEKTNLDVVRGICTILDDCERNLQSYPYANLITFVVDRPGHDQRYAIDAGKISIELDWKPKETFESGLEKTVLWYLKNEAWCSYIQNGSCSGERIGLKSGVVK